MKRNILSGKGVVAIAISLDCLEAEVLVDELKLARLDENNFDKKPEVTTAARKNINVFLHKVLEGIPSRMDTKHDLFDPECKPVPSEAEQ